MDRKAMVRQLEESQGYRLAYRDPDLLSRPESRLLRLQLEYFKPELYLSEAQVNSTVILFGSARIPAPEDASEVILRAQRELEASPGDPELIRKLEQKKRLGELSRYYEESRRFSEIVSTMSRTYFGGTEYVVLTGGGPGIMEAGNRGASEVGARTVGLNISLPFEQHPNPYITPGLCFQFHYFAVRKLHFLLRAKALVVAPGGFGTFDELFEVLTLIQTHRTAKIPVVLFSQEFWENTINFRYLADCGVISDEDLKLFRFAENAEEALQIIREFYRILCG
ncbi:MAG: LOG family protein [Planctomycetia bacterium]|nr:LOG family protein [Planctomycetia bacterium]